MTLVDQYIEKHGKRLYGLCRTLLYNDLSDADDLYQETWLKVCAKFALYNHVNEFEGWLTQICVNTYRDILRRKKRSPIFDKFNSQESKDTVMESVASVINPDLNVLQTAVQQLPEKLRMTIILYYFQELDINQTARVLRVPTGTVKSRLSKAKQLLKEMVQDEIEL